ncbi:MAG: histidinol-phosphate transaminase [Solirubrobacterales bacterium]
MSIPFVEKLQRIPHYEAGASSTAKVSDPVARLASNESPYPPVEGVVEAVKKAATEVNRYPDPSATRLRRALSDRYERPMSSIAVGNGSCEILLAAAEALLEPWSELVYAWPSFSMYPHMGAATAAKEVRVPLTDDYVHDLDTMAAAINDATRLVVICNPNNPTGTYIDSARIAQFLDRVPPSVLVILDEAYIEFETVEDPDSSIDLLSRFSNVVLLRTFSKAYGLAGLRVGYALGSEDFRNAVERVRQPFDVNHLAQVAGTEALEHQDDVVRRVEQCTTERLWVSEALGELGLRESASQANFCWVSLGERREAEVVNALAEHGVAVRPGEGLGAPGHLRATYGTRAENERFVEALREAVSKS